MVPNKHDKKKELLRHEYQKNACIHSEIVCLTRRFGERCRWAVYTDSSLDIGWHTHGPGHGLSWELWAADPKIVFKETTNGCLSKLLHFYFLEGTLQWHAFYNFLQFETGICQLNAILMRYVT